MNLFETLPGFCKYMSDADAVLEGIFKKRKIRFTQPSALNDPLDCNPVLKMPSSINEHTMYKVSGIDMPSENLWFHVQLVESHMDQYGVLSLTKNPLSPDMWSSYANGHRGFLLEFAHDFYKSDAFRSPDGQTYSVSEVAYVDTHLIDIESCLDASGTLRIDQFRQELFYRKTKRWKREKEYRMVRPLSELGKKQIGLHIGIERDPELYLSDLPRTVIRSVTFGAKMAPQKKRWIIEKCQDTDIQFLQCLVYPMALDDEGLSPQIQLIPLDDPTIRSNVLRMDPQLLLMATPDIVGRTTESLLRVNQLPYYQGYEKLVNMMYEYRKRQAKDDTR